MPLGRPRSFDADKALDRAMMVFWLRGYEGASLPELTKAMGINRPSMYAVFGNKAELFQKAIDRYTAQRAAYIAEALQAPTARGVAEKMLEGSIDMLTNPRHPSGCLLVHGALACGKEAAGVGRGLTSRRVAGEAAFRKRFQRARAEGDLPAQTDAAELAAYLATVIYGMSVLAAGGAGRNKLRGVADLALRAIPA